MKEEPPAPTFVRLLARTLGFAVIAVLTLLALFQAYKPLPPKIELVFTGFARHGSEDFAILSLTNSGPGIARVHEHHLHVEIQVSNRTVGWTPTNATMARYPPAHHREFLVPLPPGTIQWQATTIYEHLTSHDLFFALERCVNRSDILHHLPEPISNPIRSMLWLAPDPWNVVKIYSAVQTNAPSFGVGAPP